MSLSPTDGLSRAAAQLYRAYHLPAPVILHADGPADYARLIGSLHRGSSPSIYIAALMLPAMAAVLGMLGLLRPMGLFSSMAAIFVGIMAATWPVSPFAFTERVNRFVRLANRVCVVTLLVVAGAIAWVVAGPSCAAARVALLGAAVGLARAGALVNGGIPGRLGIALALRRPLPLFGMGSAQALLRERLVEALADLGVTAGGWGRGLGAAHDDEPVLREIATQLQRRVAWRTHELVPLLGRRTRRPDADPLDLTEVAGEPPLILAAAARLHRGCGCATFLEGAVIVLADEPRVTSAPAAAAPHAIDPTEVAAARLSLPFVWRTALDRLPMRPGRWLLAKTIDGEPDPARRLEALLAMRPAAFFAALGRRPVDEGREGALFVAGAREAPTALVRVIDQARDANGGGRVHWLPVPPHLATAHEAVAWTFGKAPGAYQPSHET